MDIDDFDSAPDLDDLLDPRDAQMEAEFRDLEQEAEVTKLKRRMAGSTSSERRSDKSDPLADLKGDLDGTRPEPTDAERYILVLCPKCKAKNRTNMERVRTHLPRCGRCKEPLTFTRR